jgi:hypothetical protein
VPEYLEKTRDTGSRSRLRNTAGMTYCRDDERWPSVMTTGLKVNSIEGQAHCPLRPGNLSF